MTVEDLFALEQVAQGHSATGTLAEWPFLTAAFRRAGLTLPANTEVWRLQTLCKQLVHALREQVPEASLGGRGS
jgi:hypothetical protein